MTRIDPLRRPALATGFLTTGLLAAPVLALAGWAGAAATPAATVQPAAATPTLQQAEVEELLDERIDAIRSMSSAEIWREAARVGGLIGDEFGSDFDAAVEAKMKAAPTDPRTILFLATLRLTGDDVDYALVASSVTPVLSHADTDLARAATELLGGIAPDVSDRDVKGDAADALLGRADSAAAPIDLRVAASVAATRLGSGSQIAAARRILGSFLESSDPNLRAAGALGFAEIGSIQEVDGVEDELDRLSQLPGDQGRLARAYLDQLRQDRFYESRLRRMRRDEGNRRLGSKLPKDLDRIEKLISVIQEYHLEGDQVDRDELVEAAMQGMLQRLDRHSSYFSPKSYEKFEQDLEAEYGGIGAYVQNDPNDNLFTITRPIYSGPAYEAGLGTDDKIVRIDDWPTVGEAADDIIKRLKGKPGTDVRLYVWRRGMDANLIDRPTDDMVTVVKRAQISIPSVHSQLLPGNIGLVELQTFSRNAAQDVYNAIQELTKESGQERLSGIVLDLRNNTGGLLTQAREVADLFLPEGAIVVKTESRFREGTVYKTRARAYVDEDIPVAVLINRFSASASEIVSGALQDLGRATLVGQRSFGKGSVQSLLRMPEESDDLYSDENRNGRRDNWEPITRDFDGDGEFDYAPRIKLTIERYLLPLGRSIHRELDEEGNIVSPGGVSPDQEVNPKRRETWRLVEMRRIQDTRKLREWVSEQFEKDPETFERLAFCDFGDPEAYPGFDELYASLDTNLIKEDVRFLLRIDVRRRVQDVRGSAFPLGDFSEDLQLQAAIEDVLTKSNVDRSSIEEYAATFEDRSEEDDDRVAAAPEARPSGAGLQRALALISEAEDGTLSKESAAELREILGRFDDEEN
ncbi:MAG: S41 family peptidase [Planctomycetota bacterium]